MKKFFKLLSVAALAITSFATVANAAITEDIYKPEWVIEVVDVDAEGWAQIDVSVEVDTPLSVTSSRGKYTGAAITMTDLLLKFDESVFNVAEISGQSAFGDMNFNPVTGNFFVSFTWSNDVNLVKQGSVIRHGCFWAPLKDASLTVEEVNALDFATVVKAGLQIGDWASQSGSAAFINSFYNDGTAEFDCAYRVGAEPVTPPTPPAPTASVAIKGAYKTTDAAWIAEKGNTMFWGVDFANGGFNGTAVAKIFSDAKERELTIATPAGAEINGEASFGVFVIVGDSTDAIGLTITSGDVTATAAPVAYADAE